MQEIETYVQQYFGIAGRGLSAIGGLFSETRLQKSDFLLKTEQYARSIHFVKSGYLRVFAYNADGSKEITQWISGRGMFLTDLSGFMFGTPSRWNIQALSDCELYSITKADFRRIGEHVDNWAELEKLFIAKCFVTLENRVFGQLSMTAEEKVRALMESDPEMFLHVPLQYIASMLGMTPETLSRMRRKMTS